MIDIRILEKDDSRYRQVLKNRKADASVVDKLLELQKTRKKCIAEAEQKKAEQNKYGPVIAQKKRAGESADAELQLMQKYAQEGKELTERAQQADSEVQELLKVLPNFLHESVPVGNSDADNRIEKIWGEPRKFSFKAKEHFELGNGTWIDFERAGKVAGARFAFLKGPVARLERALLNFMLDMHTRKHGYQEIMAPYMVNSQTMFGTANFPKFYDDVFHLVGTDYHLIPTAEVPVTNYFADEILNESDLPISFTCFTPCFRSEAGSHGRDTKGLIRQHQFHKVELVKFSHPSRSYEDHEKLTSDAEAVLMALELPFQRAALCSGDIGANSAKTFDLNVWLPSQNAYREISSCSIFEDFQARRAQIRFRPSGGGKPEFVHTINGSGLAIGRTTIAVLENYQNEDGSVTIPKALVPFMDGTTKISAV